MNRLFKFTRIILALMLALGALGFYASAALAAPPVNYSYPFAYSYKDDTTCSIPFIVSGNGYVHEIDFYNNNGTLYKEIGSIVEQDTFAANGVTLVGDSYHYNSTYQFDSNGNLISDLTSGVAEKIHLPDGSLFIAAGQINFLTHSGPTFSVDHGNSGNLAAFCAAFTP